MSRALGFVVVMMALLSTSLFVPAAADTTTPAGPPPAAVDARPEPGGGICAGQPRDQIHRYFRSATGRIPIRCGTWNGNRGFGVRKLAAKARWNVWYKNMISITLNNPRHVIKEGTTWVYRTRTFKKCNPPYHFRVVVQRAKVGGTKRMRGVITAYQKFS